MNPEYYEWNINQNFDNEYRYRISKRNSNSYNYESKFLNKFNLEILFK